MGTSDEVGVQHLVRNPPAILDEDLAPLEAKLVAGAAAGEPVDGGEGPFSLSERLINRSAGPGGGSSGRSWPTRSWLRGWPKPGQLSAH